MKMSTHSDFILTPIAYIINDAANSCSLLSNGMSSYPLGEYLLQSIFLKMTGAQEQKFKCVAWELATVDYSYRYELFREGLGECSSYKDKNCIFGKLTEYTNQFQDLSIDYNSLLNNAKNDINFVTSKFGQYFGKSQDAYTIIKNNTSKFINDTNNLFNLGCSNPFDDNNIVIASKNKNDDGKNIYGLLWKHRNRCAHNLQSYQDNLPTLSELNKPIYKYYNYLVFMYILLLIDYKLIEYFKKFLEITEKVV